MEIQELQKLISRCNAGTATLEERVLVEEWYEQQEGDDVELSTEELERLRGGEFEAVLERIEKRPGVVRRMMPAIKWAAACIIVAVGVIFYLGRHKGGAQDVAMIKTIHTGRGETNTFSLPDGTKVWLNALSSVRWPASFGSGVREIELEGEAYFEVAEDAHQPFRVRYSGQSLEVLGTHFNIEAYPDEPVITTTLLEGLVKINGKDLLKPGQQASVDKEARAMRIGDVDLNAAVAWKNGVLQFNEADIHAIMRQVSRWYNVDVEFGGGLPEGHYTGKIKMSDSLAHVLKILELYGVRFSTNGRKILVQN